MKSFNVRLLSALLPSLFTTLATGFHNASAQEWATTCGLTYEDVGNCGIKKVNALLNGVPGTKYTYELQTGITVERFDPEIEGSRMCDKEIKVRTNGGTWLKTRQQCKGAWIIQLLPSGSVVFVETNG